PFGDIETRRRVATVIDDTSVPGRVSHYPYPGATCARSVSDFGNCSPGMVARCIQPQGHPGCCRSEPSRNGAIRLSRVPIGWGPTGARCCVELGPACAAPRVLDRKSV